MIIHIDFNSEEAIYVQLRNQIIIGIATSDLKEGDTLPSVRQLADNIGINMHTVNKAYSVLRKEGLVKLDRRKGAIVSIDIDRMQAINEMTGMLRIVLAKAICKDITEDEVHDIISGIYREFIMCECKKEKGKDT
ncbi:GntR family transcriptional regulator [Parasporobacterium paucivorans]